MNAVSNLRRIFIPNRGSLIPGKIQSVLDRPKHWMSSTKTPLQSNIPPKIEENNINQILCNAVWTKLGNYIVSFENTSYNLYGNWEIKV